MQIISSYSKATGENQIKMVGSSTVYHFASVVAQELRATRDVPTSVVESIEADGGMKIFCASKDVANIINTSRAMKAKK